MDWDSLFAALLMPGPMMSGMSKTDILSLTWPQLTALFDRFKEFSSNEASTNKTNSAIEHSHWQKMWEEERTKYLDKD